MKDVNILIQNGVDIQKGLENFGDLATYNETLETFITDASDKITNLEVFLSKMDLENYAILVHSLKGDARYFGFLKLAEYSYNHEMASKESDLNFVTTNFDTLKQECLKMIEISKKYLGVSPSVQTDRKTILVADDSNIIIGFVKKVLGEEYHLLTAHNGSEAVSFLEKNQVDVLLLDLNMPLGNGFDVLNYMRDNDLFTKTSVSILTGNDVLETDQKAFEYPIVDMLKKPFDETKLKNIIDKTLTNKDSY